MAFVSDYLDGGLSAAERAAFEAHVADCRDCLVYLRSFRATVALAKEAGADDEAVLRDLPEELVRAILAARGSKP